MTTEIALVFAVLLATIVLFVSEWLRVDVVAILVLLALAWLGLVEPAEARAGFSSNAVISIIAVMILGHGIERTGVMGRIVRPLLRAAGKSETRLVGLVTSAVGGISAFMQNIGAAALFLPALMRISRRQRIPLSRLLMPVGFGAILGGTLTMVASGPLIILNDLLKQSSQPPFGLFDVTPVGLALLGAGVLYFVLLGRWVLPARSGREDASDRQAQMLEAWELPSVIHGCAVPDDSPLVGKTVEQAQLWSDYGLNLLALRRDGVVKEAPWRKALLGAGQEFALLGEADAFERFVADFSLARTAQADEWVEELRSRGQGGFAQFIVRPRASIVGQSLRQLGFRLKFGVEPIALLSSVEGKCRDFSDTPLQAGDALVAYGSWERLRALAAEEHFLLSSCIDAETSDPSKAAWAAVIFLAAISLAVAGFPLSISLLTGAAAMILAGVVPIGAAYRAVDWRTVFLLAGLIPLGTAMDKTGAAAFVAQWMTNWFAGGSPIVLMLAVALLATLFSLFMSNVAATVLLVPLVLVIGRNSGIDGRALALLVAVSASNSFVLPTHQVNALFMAPGGYRNRDFIRAGGVMTLLFLTIAVGMIWWLFVA